MAGSVTVEDRRMRIEIELGTTLQNGASVPAMLDIEELLATRLLVQGNSGSGKSHLLRRLLEQSASQVQQLIIDPEGDFASLADAYGHVVIDADRSIGELETIARRVRQHRISAVLNLESLDADLQMRAAAVFLNALFETERDHWYPMLVVVDEAQLFAPVMTGDVSDEARRQSLAAMTNLMCRGRKRGLAGVLATQRLAKLAKNVAAEASNFLMGRTFLDIDMARAADLLGLERRQAETFRELSRGQFVALGPAISRRPLSVKVGTVETGARAGTPKLTPLPEQPAEEARDLILAPVPAAAARAPAERRTATPAPTTNEILEQLVRSRPAAAAEEPANSLSPEELDGHYRAFAVEIMAEESAGFASDAVLFQDFQARCRIRRVAGTLPLGEFKWYLNLARAGLGTTAHPDMERLARAIPADLQAVCLILAGAALAGEPCPTDKEIARLCGMHSPGRARSQIRHLEKAGTVVLRVDMRGNRVVAFPDLNCESAAGNPNGPAKSRVAFGGEAAE